ncbi:MAG: porin family protein [Coxiellaceae bacterium]|nr:porin family protein [Coxiellaceae bacterium]
MKKYLNVVAALSLSSTVLANGLPEEMPMSRTFAPETGLYLGVQGGFGTTDWKSIDKTPSVNTTKKKIVQISRDNGPVSRILLGFDINRYLALECGYSHFFNKPLAEVDREYKKFFREYTRIKYTCEIDMMGKIKAPLIDDFDLYAKLGTSYLVSIYETDNRRTIPNRNPKNVGLTYGAGLDYMVNPNFVANVEWLHFNGRSRFSSSNYQPGADAVMLGLRYKFNV